MAAAATENVALVFGASGISGWAVMGNLFSYPTSTTFTRIIGLTHRPFDGAASALPIEDVRLELHSGINLREELNIVKDKMEKTIHRLEDVTHVYYCAYSNVTAYSQDVMAIRDINLHMTGNAVRAVDALCRNLRFLVLQTGSNYYGVAVFRFQDKIAINPPLKEDQGRIPAPYGDEVFYYGQADIIKEVNAGKLWKWCEVRPDAIVGFVPGMTSMTFLEPIALFLSLWRYVNGPNASVPFVGTKANYLHTNTDSSQDIIAKAEIHLSATVGAVVANGEAYNIADYSEPYSWVQKWPVMVSYFDLQGIPPNEPGEKYGLRERTIPPEAWVFTLVAGYSLLCRDRAFCLDKIRAAGFKEELPLGKGHFIGFDRMVAAKIIPRPSKVE